MARGIDKSKNLDLVCVSDRERKQRRGRWGGEEPQRYLPIPLFPFVFNLCFRKPTNWYDLFLSPLLSLSWLLSSLSWFFLSLSICLFLLGCSDQGADDVGGKERRPGRNVECQRGWLIDFRVVLVGVVAVASRRVHKRENDGLMFFV